MGFKNQQRLDINSLLIKNRENLFFGKLTESSFCGQLYSKFVRSIYILLRRT